MPIATPDVYAEMIDRAKSKGFAYPAINVTSSQSLNAALKGFADAGSDGIIQFSTGGAEYGSGQYVKDMVTGAVALAEFAHVVAKKYPVNIAIHTDHCPKDKLDTYVRPLLEISRQREANGQDPLFQSHMWDGSAVPMEEIRLGVVMLCHNELAIAARMARVWADNGAPVSVHVDAKTPRPEIAQMRADLGDLPQVVFSRRHVCEWGTFSLVRATQDAAALLLDRFPDLTHVILVSGACLPLRPRPAGADAHPRPTAEHAPPAGGRAALAAAVLGRHFLQADAADAAEQAWRERLALGIDDSDAGRDQQAAADGADDAALHQHIGVLERAACAGGVELGHRLGTMDRRDGLPLSGAFRECLRRHGRDARHVRLAYSLPQLLGGVSDR